MRRAPRRLKKTNSQEKVNKNPELKAQGRRIKPQRGHDQGEERKGRDSSKG